MGRSHGKTTGTRFFLKCIEQKATSLNEEGMVEVDFKPGFGLKVNEKKLISLADAYLKI